MRQHHDGSSIEASNLFIAFHGAYFLGGDMYIWGSPGPGLGLSKAPLTPLSLGEIKSFNPSKGYVDSWLARCDEILPECARSAGQDLLVRTLLFAEKSTRVRKT